MAVEFVGANPSATLLRGSARAGFVSLWEAEWSTHGPGFVLLTWVDGDDAVRLLTPDPALGGWLAETFSQYFPELEELPAVGDPVECQVDEWQIGPDVARVRVSGTDGSSVAATISRPIGTRPGEVIDWQLGPARWSMTNLLTFCADATLEVDGARVLGRPEIANVDGRPTSTAFIATHETWSKLD